jgi:hypothetical protein
VNSNASPFLPGCSVQLPFEISEKRDRHASVRAYRGLRPPPQTLSSELKAGAARVSSKHLSCRHAPSRRWVLAEHNGSLRTTEEGTGRFKVDVCTFPQLPEFSRYDVVVSRDISRRQTESPRIFANSVQDVRRKASP